MFHQSWATFKNKFWCFRRNG